MSEELSIGITLIGAGRVGMNLVRHFVRCGMHVCAVIEPRIEQHASIRSAAPDARVLTELPPTLPHETDVCVLAVPDDDIAPIAARLAERPSLHSGALVFHVSGVRGADDLQPLQENGCHAGCLHPIQSFPTPSLPESRLRDIGCGIEGPDDFHTRARDFATLLGWMPLRILPQHKALYHAACVFAGNFTTVVAAQAETLLRRATGADATLMDYLLPMMQSVLAQIGEHPAEQVLTGPASRADTVAIASHVQAIGDAAPSLLPDYLALSRAAADIAQLGEREKKLLREFLEQSD